MPRRRREYIAHIHPRQRAPPHAIEAHIDIQHRRHRLARRRRREARGHGRRRRVRLEDRGDDEEQRAHPDGGDDEREPPPERLDEEEHEERGGDDLDDAVDARGEEGVRRACETNLRTIRLNQFEFI